MADELTERDLERLNLGQRARGWIVNSYAQFEHLLLDLLVRAQSIPAYANRRHRVIPCARTQGGLAERIMSGWLGVVWP